MKKLLAVTVVLCSVFVLSGCGKDKLSKTDEAMKEYATNFYNAFQKGTQGMTETNVTVFQLRDAVNKNLIKFNIDLSKLEKCTDDSYVTLKINATNNDVDSIEYHMNCSK